MRIEKEEVVIPEQTVTKTVYIAEDGERFASESACKAHEALIKREKNQVWKSRITGMEDYCDGRSITLYFLSSEQDYDSLVELLGAQFNAYCDSYRDCGPGWYIYQWIDNDSRHGGTDILYYLQRYISNIEYDWRKWKNDVERAINNKRKEMNTSQE